jgi:hypothetical protein
MLYAILGLITFINYKSFPLEIDCNKCHSANCMASTSARLSITPVQLQDSHTFQCLKPDVWDRIREADSETLATACVSAVPVPNISIPIVFIHQGGVKRQDENLAPHTVNAAAKFNSRVMLISVDGGFDDIGYWDQNGINFIKVDSNSSMHFVRAKEFETLYVHMSSNAYEFELISFQRWFLLESIMKTHGIKMFSYIDTDVLLLTNMTAGLGCYYNCPCMLSQPRGAGSSSGHSSFWNVETLTKFNSFVLSTYNTSLPSLKTYWDKIRANYPPGKARGGVSDMILLGRFMDGHGCCNGLDNRGGMFDHKTAWSTYPEFYQDQYGIPHYIKDQQHVRLKTLHFQGGSKSMLSTCGQ